CEFDIQEDPDTDNNQFRGTLIDWINGNATPYSDYTTGIGKLPIHEWHTIAGSIMQDPSGKWLGTFYVDGNPIYSVDAPAICTTDPEYLILGVGTHSSSPPHDMLVDWVHVWQKNGTAVTPQAGFTGANGSGSTSADNTVTPGQSIGGCYNYYING